MGLKEYIGEDEAARIAGISVTTLERFVEAGYLVVERDNDGLRLYAKEELERLFGVSLFDVAPEVENQESIQIEEERNDKIVDLRVVGGGKVSHSVSQSITPSLQPEPPKPVGQGILLLEQEITKLRNIMNLQEKLLEHREGELSELKKERDWLRGRIERLEEKADRDQLILLSEAQTVRRLLTAHIERKSPVRAALEWFGFVPSQSPQQQGTTIDVTRQG